MSIALVSLKEAKDQLRVTNPDADDDIVSKIEIASSLTLQVLKLSAVPDTWLVGSPAEIVAPAYERGLTLAFLAGLYFNREADITALLSQGMVDLIRLGRTPTIA